MKNHKNAAASFITFNVAYGAYIIILCALFGLTLAYPVQINTAAMYSLLFFALVPIALDALKDLYNKKITTELFLILATGVALTAREEQAITVVLIIMHLAKYAEEFIEEKTGRAIESLVRLVSTKVTAVVNGHEQLLETHQIQPSMRLIIKTGEQIPVDGIIVDGQASINESFLTGESTPLEKGIKDPS